MSLVELSIKRAIEILFIGAFVLAHAQNGASRAQTRSPQEKDVVAIIDSITINGSKSAQAPGASVRVERAKDNKIEAGERGTRLYANDKVKTGDNTLIILRLLDDLVVKDKEVIIAANSWIRILDKESIHLQSGKSFFKVIKGFFEVKTAYVRMGAKGTEFEIEFSEDGRTKLTVIEGTVQVQTNEPIPQVKTGERFEKTTFDVPEKHEVLLLKTTPTSKEPRRSSEDSIRAVLAWTNEVIVTTQPSYPAKNLFPNFVSSERRAQTFVDARLRTIWNKDADSYQALGNIYIDWGRGAKALEAYKQALVINPDLLKSPAFLTNLGEAYRLTGQFEDAEEQINRALKIDSKYAPALNALGNIYMDKASTAYDKGSESLAKGRLEEAKNAYEISLKELDSQKGSPLKKGVAQSNLGEAYLNIGDIAFQQGSSNDRNQYRAALRAFTSSKDLYSPYPFARVGMGRVYQRLGRIAQEAGGQENARDLFDKAKYEYTTVVKKHPDLAEAFVHLGTLFQELGPDFKNQAISNYANAIKANPTYAAAYYQLGILLEKNSSREAAEYFQTYLQVEADVFKGGQRASYASTGSTPYVIVPDLRNLKEKDALRAIAGKDLTVGKVVPLDDTKERIVINQYPLAGTRVLAETPIDITVGKRIKAVRVPDLRGLTQDAAENAIQEAGFKVGIIEKKRSTKPAGTIIEQKPKAKSKALPGVAIDVVIAEPNK